MASISFTTNQNKKANKKWALLTAKRKKRLTLIRLNGRHTHSSGVGIIKVSVQEILYFLAISHNSNRTDLLLEFCFRKIALVLRMNDFFVGFSLAVWSGWLVGWRKNYLFLFPFLIRLGNIANQ